MGFESPVNASWWNFMLPQLLVIQVLSRHTKGLFDLFIGRGCALTSFWGSWRGSSSLSHRSNLFGSPDRAMLSNNSCRTALIIFSGAHLMICSHQNLLEQCRPSSLVFLDIFLDFLANSRLVKSATVFENFCICSFFFGYFGVFFFYFPQAVHMNCWIKLTVSFNSFCIFWYLLWWLKNLKFWQSNSMGKINFPRNFSLGCFWLEKDLWGYIDGSGTTVKPIDTTKSGQWVTNDVTIISWILRSVDQQIVHNLRPHKTSKKMWEYLKKIYNQDNSARQFRLEHEISEDCQGNKSIQDDYSRLLNLWMGFEDLVYQLFLKTVSLLCKNIMREINFLWNSVMNSKMFGPI